MAAEDSAHDRLLSRRRFVQRATAGTALVALGGALYRFAPDRLTRLARAEKLADGRPRLPPGQRVIEKLKPMGGEPGSPQPEDFRLKIHGEVEKTITIDFKALLAMKQVELVTDVHCVTGWSVLGARFVGVRLADLADRARLTKDAHFVIFEAAHGYTANITLKEALAPNVMVVHQLDGRPFQKQHGAPVRALVPDRYFWKSAKWLQGIRFSKRDAPGYWETRGYHNRADPWREERYG